MNLTVTLSTQLFLNKTKEFLASLQKNVFVKEKLLKRFNFDTQCLEKSVAAHTEAQLAQTLYDNAAANAAVAKEVFEKQFETAKIIYRKDCAYLMVALKHSPQKQLEVGLIGKQEAKTTSELLANICQFYNQVLNDQEIIAEVIKFHLKKEDLENSRSELNAALSTYEVLVKDRPDIETAINNKDEAIMKLTDNIAEIQALLFEAFGNIPKEFKKLDLPVINDEIGQEIMFTMVKDSSIT